MRAPLAAFLVCLLAVSGARSQGIDPDKAQAWLEKTYGIKSERVAVATPDELVVLRTIEPRPPSDFRVVAHYETFTGPDPLTPPSSDRDYLINCPSRRFHVDRIESFSEHGGRGGQSTSFGPTVWGMAVPNSPDERIIAAVCGPSPADIALQAARSPAPSPPVQDLTPASVPAAEQPQAVPTPLPPLPPPVTASRATPGPAPKAGPARVQLFAGPDRAAAQHFIVALPARLLASAGGRRPEIVEATSRGRPVYRVQIAGFASPAEAARFCAVAKASGQDCFVFSPPGR
jgi:hypothetical protein